MKLLVIVLCLLSERFLIHASSNARFWWFDSFANSVMNKMSKLPVWLVLLIITLPISLITFILTILFGDWLFGFVGLLLNILVLHYCIGPENPFYPSRNENLSSVENIASYLCRVNNELFAVVFFYIFFGVFGALLYRLVSLSVNVKILKQSALLFLQLLDWLPVRITALIYLFVGNFQSGIENYVKNFLLSPSNNESILRESGMAAVDLSNNEEQQIIFAERQVEHAIILLLAVYALCLIVVWL